MATSEQFKKIYGVDVSHLNFGDEITIDELHLEPVFMDLLCNTYNITHLICMGFKDGDTLFISEGEFNEKFEPSETSKIKYNEMINHIHELYKNSPAELTKLFMFRKPLTKYREYEKHTSINRFHPIYFTQYPHMKYYSNMSGSPFYNGSYEMDLISTIYGRQTSLPFTIPPIFEFNIKTTNVLCQHIHSLKNEIDELKKLVETQQLIINKIVKKLYSVT
jgi:hypothetical protein